MKIKPANADRFLAHPDPGCVALLLYGPDEGLVRERGADLAAARVGKPPDPMRLVDLTDADLKADPARLADEACGLALIPGDRLIRVRTTGDGPAKTVEGFLQGCANGTLKPDALVVIEAGDLNPRSSLRKMCEATDNAAAIACYADEIQSLTAMIDRMAREAGTRVDPAAMDMLTERLGADRGVTRRELEKLFLYKQGDKTPVDLDDVEACLPEEPEAGFGMLADVVAGGDLDRLLDDLHGILSGGLPPVTVLRGVSSHFQRLHGWVSAIEQGSYPSDLLKKARPPIHFKRTSSLRGQLRSWTRPDVETALQSLLEAERQCKTTGMPDTLIAERVLMSLTRRAARRVR